MYGLSRQVVSHGSSLSRQVSLYIYVCYQDYRVSSFWRQRHSAMTPLFVETQASQSQAGRGADDSPPEGDMGVSTQIRATQDVQQFSATQQPGGSHQQGLGGGGGNRDWGGGIDPVVYRYVIQ